MEPFEPLCGWSSTQPRGPIPLSRENSPDHFFDRNFLKFYIANRQSVEKCLANGNDAVAFDFQLDRAGFSLDDFAVFAEMLGRTIRPAFALDRDQLKIRETVQHFGQTTIEKDRATINNDDALAKFLDIG